MRKNASKTCPLCDKKIKRDGIGCQKHYGVLRDGRVGTTFNCLQCGKENTRPGKNTKTPPKFCDKRCHGDYLRDHSTDPDRVAQRIAMNEVFREKLKTGWHPMIGIVANDNQRAGLAIGWALGAAKNKGDLASYPAIHHWIRKQKGRAKECERCGESVKLVQWANVSGEYYRDVDDYIALCRSCHWAFDKENPKRPERLFDTRRRRDGTIYYCRHK